jgi:hypothetical protein
MTALRALWRRLFPPSDGTICADLRQQTCAHHEALNRPCRCLRLLHHRDMHECGQGARWGDYVRSGT